MATLETRTTSTSTTASYRVKWREDGAWQSETFGGDRKATALRFQRNVEQHGNLRAYGDRLVAQAVDQQGEVLDGVVLRNTDRQRG
ncbi:MAG: hypothetical protein M3P93_00975 [Actinomycetota bacterium]|nr:hypothetical protein [Actinomycetota bacterium]